MLATVAIVPVKDRQRRVGGGHLGALSDSVNAFLQFYFKDPKNSRKNGDLAPLILSKNRVFEVIFKGQLNHDAQLHLQKGPEKPR